MTDTQITPATPDPEAPTPAKTARVRTLASATSKGARQGARASTARLWRGLTSAPADILGYVIAADAMAAVEDAPAGDPRTKATAQLGTVRRERRANTVTVILGSIAWWTGGLTTFAGLAATWHGWAAVTAVYLILVAVAVAATQAAWRGKVREGWMWPVRLWTIAAITGVSLWAGVAVGVWPLRVVWICAVVGWLLWAAGDGSITDNLGNATSAETVESQASDNRIVAGLSEKLGIKSDAKSQIKVIGVGLQPVDKIWSKLTIQTPGTITTQQVVDAVPGLASFLGISAERIDAVGLDDGTGRDIEGVVEIWIANGDQWKDTPEWPLLHADRANVWGPVPFLVTDKGKQVDGLLLFAMWMLVSKPRHGKTFAMRLLALAAALDPSCDIAVFDFKVGGRDWLWGRRIAVAAGYGPSDDTIKAFHDYLTSVLDRAQEMGDIFQALPSHLVPNGQLTAEACAHEPRLRPLLIFVDEVHHALTHPKYGKEITRVLSKVARELPFMGVNTFIASQRADVKTSIPSEVRSLASNRVAGKLYTSRDSGDVLGDAANEAGYNAKHLRPVKGLFIVHGVDDTSSFDGYTKGRAYLVNNEQADEIAARAYEARRNAGAIQGQESHEPPPEKLLAALEILRASGGQSMRSEELSARLDTTAQRLLAEIGVKSRQEPSDGYRKHVHLTDLEEAVRRHGRPLRVVS